MKTIFSVVVCCGFTALCCNTLQERLIDKMNERSENTMHIDIKNVGEVKAWSMLLTVDNETEATP
jgi:hypothetical protein